MGTMYGDCMRNQQSPRGTFAVAPFHISEIGEGAESDRWVVALVGCRWLQLEQLRLVPFESWS